MSVGAKVRGQLARPAPRLEEAVVRANWRRYNRDRGFDPAEIADPVQRRLAGDLDRDGVAVSTFGELVGDSELFEQAAARAHGLHSAWRPEDAEEGSKASFLTKLAPPHFAPHAPVGP